MVRRNNFYNLELLVDHYCADELLKTWGIWSKSDLPYLGYPKIFVTTNKTASITLTEDEVVFIDYVISLMLEYRLTKILFDYYIKSMRLKELGISYGCSTSGAKFLLDKIKKKFWCILITELAKILNKDTSWIAEKTDQI